MLQIHSAINKLNTPKTKSCRRSPKRLAASSVLKYSSPVACERVITPSWEVARVCLVYSAKCLTGKHANKHITLRDMRRTCLVSSRTYEQGICRLNRNVFGGMRYTLRPNDDPEIWRRSRVALPFPFNNEKFIRLLKKC